MEQRDEQVASSKDEREIRVLIIDDLEDNRTLLRLDLEDEIEDIHVDEADNGEQGLSLLEANDYSLVICDLMMPGMDGFTVFKEANKRLPIDTIPPFIFLSANKQKEVAERGLQLGAIDFLTKPYDLTELIYKVKNLSRIKILTNSLRNSRQELAEANKSLKSMNSEKDEMLKIVSHDMRNPLNNIIGLASILREESEEGEVELEEVEHIGSVIERSGKKLLNLVNTLLDVAKIESGNMKANMEMVNVPELVTQAVESVEMLAKKKKLEIRRMIPEDEILYELDQPKMEQVLGNLLSNAIKFTPQGGEVTVQVKTSYHSDYELPRLQIAVSDSGIGIPPDKQKEIFEKFGSYQRKGTDREIGSGLGLSIVKHFVELQGGTIAVESKTDEGATFNITFPARNN